MFKKILVVDDVDVINAGVIQTLKSIEVQEIVHATYCDEAYLKMKRAVIDKVPFDLLICDLSFIRDHRVVDIVSGDALIKLARTTFPNLKIIAFSVEDHPEVIKSLWDTLLVDAYVCKDRESSRELQKAIQAVFSQERYLPLRLERILKQSNTIVLTQHDIEVLTMLAQGSNQDQIEARFKREGISPSSRSSIEKRLKELREEFNAQTTIHLITILKDNRLL